MTTSSILLCGLLGSTFIAVGTYIGYPKGRNWTAGGAALGLLGGAVVTGIVAYLTAKQQTALTSSSSSVSGLGSSAVGDNVLTGGFMSLARK